MVQNKEQSITTIARLQNLLLQLEISSKILQSAPIWHYTVQEDANEWQTLIFKNEKMVKMARWHTKLNTRVYKSVYIYLLEGGISHTPDEIQLRTFICNFKLVKCADRLFVFKMKYSVFLVFVSGKEIHQFYRYL